MAIQRIQLPLSMPSATSGHRTCDRCLRECLQGQPGIRSVELIARDFAQGQMQDRLELTYDPSQVSLLQINRHLRRAGGCLDEAMAHLVLPVRGVVSAGQEAAIEASLNRLPGVLAIVSSVSQTIRLEFDRRRCAVAEIVDELDRFGVAVIGSEGLATAGGAVRSRGDSCQAISGEKPFDGKPAAEPEGHEGEVLRGGRVELAFAGMAGTLLLAGYLAGSVGDSPNGRLGLLIASYILGGWFPGQAMFQTIRRFRIDVDLLMFAAAFGAAALGHYEEGALLLFLFSLGGAGEELAMNRARGAIRALTKLVPKTATLMLDGEQLQNVRVEQLRVGDRVLVSPGQWVPADGMVIHGSSSINQAPITGESIPAAKEVSDAVYAGTINGQGVLHIQVSKLASDNTLAKVIRLVEEAQTTKSKTQVFTDQVEKYYVPIVLGVTGALVVVPPLLGLHPGRAHEGDWGLWQGWFYQAMAFLTAASPCALAIGTPAAVLSGIARAARLGVLIKGGQHLENLGRVQAIAFDKTGTLTQGKPKVADIRLADPAMDADRFLSLVAAIERTSQHPLAQAIADEAQNRGCPILHAEQVQQTPGQGIRGQVDGQSLSIGRWTMFDAASPGYGWMKPLAESLESQGRSVVAVSDGSRVLGLMALADQPRPQARRMISALKLLGIRKTIMLTGDNSATAAAVAKELGVDEYHAHLLPQQKLERIRQLDREYGHVAMVGDGVNDAPALAHATVGIAMGGAASDVALETADVALLADDLSKLPQAVGLSRFARRIVIQNLAMALGVIFVLAPMAALGQAPISIAVMFHEGSTVLVVLNSLRLLGYRANA